MRCEEEFEGRKRRASTISDDQAKRKDPNARCRTFFSSVGAHIMSGAEGEGRGCATRIDGVEDVSTMEVRGGRDAL